MLLIKGYCVPLIAALLFSFFVGRGFFMGGCYVQGKNNLYDIIRFILQCYKTAF